MSNQALDPLNPSFPEYFLRIFGNKGILPYQVKCLSLGPALYFLGLVVAYFSNTLYDFIIDYGFLANSIISSITFCAIIYACHQINPTLAELDSVIKHSQNEEYAKFLKAADDEEKVLSPKFWYYFYVLITPSILVLFACLGLIGPPWLVTNGGIAARLYYLFWLIVMGITAGVSISRIGYYAFTINDYCERFVLPKRINFLVPNQVDGLKPLGSLALKFNIALVIPSLIVLIFFFRTVYVLPEIYAPRAPVYTLILLAYVVVLIFVFIFPLRNAHKSLLNGKKETIKKIQEKTAKFEAEGAIEDLEKLGAIGSNLAAYTIVKKMGTWPINFQTLVSAFATVLFPLIGGVVLQILFETLLSIR